MATTRHSHAAAHDHPAPHRHDLGPTYDSTVVMDVGGVVGGLVFYTDAEMLGSEIDIFERDCQVPLTHTAVRERHLGADVYYAGVFPALAAGDYTLAGVGQHPPVDLTIAGGAVVEIHTETGVAGPPGARAPSARVAERPNSTSRTSKLTGGQ